MQKTKYNHVYTDVVKTLNTMQKIVLMKCFTEADYTVSAFTVKIMSGRARKKNVIILAENKDLPASFD